MRKLLKKSLDLFRRKYVPVVKLVQICDRDHTYFWKLRSFNGTILAVSEPYGSRANRDEVAKRLAVQLQAEFKYE